MLALLPLLSAQTLHGQDQAFVGSNDYEKALAYLKKSTGVREVILSGGDPLTLGDSRMERVLHDLRAIQHLEIIRIGSRMPVVCPMRITDDLVSLLRRYKPVYFMTHFNHPKEISYDAALALEKLVDHGVPIFNQMVLLNGINNHAAIVQALSRRLLYLRVKPYYMFQCDPSEGSEHFRTSVEESLDIQRELWGRLSGLAMPNLSLDIPGGGGKVGFAPDFEVYASPGKRVFEGWDGTRGEYLAPSVITEQPADLETYLPEWDAIKQQPLRQKLNDFETSVFYDKFFERLIVKHHADLCMSPLPPPERYCRYRRWGDARACLSRMSEVHPDSNFRNRAFGQSCRHPRFGTAPLRRVRVRSKSGS